MPVLLSSFSEPTSSLEWLLAIMQAGNEQGQKTQIDGMGQMLNLTRVTGGEEREDESQGACQECWHYAVCHMPGDCPRDAGALGSPAVRLSFQTVLIKRAPNTSV